MRTKRFGIMAQCSSTVVGLLYLCTLLPHPAHAQDRKELPISIRQQHTPVWCWGATIAMVVEYLKDFNLEDCEALAEYDMRLGGRGLCCLGANECNRAAQSTTEMGQILGQIFDIHGQQTGALSFDDVVEQIDNDRPLIAALRKPSGGHVVVIAGYRQPDRVLVLDPIYGRAWASHMTP